MECWDEKANKRRTSGRSSSTKLFPCKSLDAFHSLEGVKGSWTVPSETHGLGMMFTFR